MGQSQYISLPQSDQDSGSVEPARHVHTKPKSTSWRAIATATSLLLLLSVTANLYFLHRQYISWGLINQLPSKYAGLRRDVPVEIVRHDDFDSPNRTIQDAAWDHPDMEPWANFVALKPEEVATYDLPAAQRWPWDVSKQVYILTAAHELHCVVSAHTMRL